MLTLCSYNRLKAEGAPVSVTCYEKQEKPGGLWNFTWRTGVDKYGEPLHNGQYRDLFSNSPKECLEFPDYTFVQHFGKSIPSYPPRPVLRDYQEGYWRFCGVSDSDVKVEHCVRHVEFNKDSSTFSVTVDILNTGETITNEFDYVIVATGHFSYPYIAPVEGIDCFKGRILHSHDFRNSSEFVNQNLLIIGGSYSAEDISLQCLKFGAKSATISYKTRPTRYKYPDYIPQRSLDHIDDDGTAVFKDGHREQFDAIIFCTGYLVKFPFLPSELTLRCRNVVYPPNLYRGIQFVNENNPADGKLLYIGMADQWYSFTLFKMQAWWAAALTKGLLASIDNKELKYKLEDVGYWEQKATEMNDDCLFQRDYIKAICDDVKCEDDLDTDKQFREWIEAKYADITTFRDYSHDSNFDNMGVAPKPKIPWFKNFDDSLEGFLNNM